jgi:hypothetical protein
MLVARLLFVCASLVLLAAALLRTWASAYLDASIVYASDVRKDALVAGGPYRYVRNPLYAGNLLLAIGLGSMASRVGFVFLLVSITIFSYRLIFREEAELALSQKGSYDSFRTRVPRLLPSLRPRVSAGGAQARWAAGFRAESWFFGLPVGMAAFALTLNVAFFGVAAFASICLLWMVSARSQSRNPA